MNTERIYMVMHREPNPWPVVTRPKSKLSQRLTVAAMSIERAVNLAAWVPVLRMPLVLLLSCLQFGVERMAELVDASAWRAAR